jgi:RNA-directed DNA polymerase
MRPSKETRRAEGRGRLGGIPQERSQVRTQSRVAWRNRLLRVNKAAKRDDRARFTALLHHVTVDALERSFRRLRRSAAAGVDGVTVEEYAQDLESRLEDLHARVHSGRYRPCPVRRVWIPKADGGLRPLGVPALEDKIVQGAVAEVLSAVYEADFMGFSYGFRPGRSPQQALKAFHTAVMTQYVNWVLDADIRSFFDSVDHEWLLRIVAHRVADPRILRLVRGWLKAGVVEEKEWTETERGTPQGSGISPLLANVFLHYVLDLWVHQWRSRQAQGQVSVVRFADDFVMGFQSRADAERLRVELEQRLRAFGLEPHPHKTRLIEFGRLPALRRKQRGDRRPSTFAFLGLTHYCGWTRDGRFVCKQRTQSKRLARKLREVKEEARRRMHRPLADQQRWLASVLRGHYRYYGVEGNSRALAVFLHQVSQIWYRSLRRRSQRPLSWNAYKEILHRLPLPPPRLPTVQGDLFASLG